MRKPSEPELPPHADDMERALVGALIGRPDLVGECVHRLKAGPQAFFDLRHRVIYETLVEMLDAGQPVGLVELTARLREDRQLKQCGDVGYVAGLPDEATGDLGHAIALLTEKCLLRDVVRVCTTIAEKARNGAPASELLDELEATAMAMRDGTSGDNEPNLRAQMGELGNDYDEAYLKPGPRGLLTGFPDFDRITGGIRPGWLVILAARPGVGKTTLALNIASHVAIHDGLPVGFISLEMSTKELLHRLVCSRARVNAMEAEQGRFTEAELVRMTEASTSITRSGLRIHDGVASLGQIGAKLRRWKRDGIRLAVVDYLGLLQTHARQSRYESTTEISNGLKRLARDVKLPVLCLAQLNRATENEGRAPRLADLRDSGAIEQDADLVAMLHRPEDAVGQNHTVDLLVPKNRHGATGKCSLHFIATQTRFESDTSARPGARYSSTPSATGGNAEDVLKHKRV